jgi:hypothetical protein
MAGSTGRPRTARASSRRPSRSSAGPMAYPSRPMAASCMRRRPKPAGSGPGTSRGRAWCGRTPGHPPAVAA